MGWTGGNGLLWKATQNDRTSMAVTQKYRKLKYVTVWGGMVRDGTEKCNIQCNRFGTEGAICKSMSCQQIWNWLLFKNARF